ncbi:MAG: nitrous oxide-stimulated promoter family protein [Paludibacteraceae bacterium]|nr:nitrous oxide-stimulated promoter family protein [Paludibacteraceae bacterium]
MKIRNHTNTKNTIERQKHTIKGMLAYYCHKYHHTTALCEECESLTAYALARLSGCRYGDAKPSCRKCTTQCYAPQQRQMMEERMRIVGPKMLYLRFFLAPYKKKECKNHIE